MLEKPQKNKQSGYPEHCSNNPRQPYLIKSPDAYNFYRSLGIKTLNWLDTAPYECNFISR